MTELRGLKQLHLCQCIDDLNEMHESDEYKNKSIKTICKTALNLYANAEKNRDSGDEEIAYVLFMRFLRMTSYLGTCKEYNRNKKIYAEFITNTQVKKALAYVTALKESLTARYDKLQKEKRLNDIKENEHIKQKIEENKQEIIQNNVLKNEDAISLPDLEEVSIHSDHLHKIITSCKFKVMILDVRPTTEFVKSHINLQNCISVPEESIKPGVSATILEKSLPPRSQAVWAGRATMDLIVMLDWNSQTMIAASTLYLLKTILLKWDVKVKYARPPVFLAGGYEDWVLRYPSLTTHPLVIPPLIHDIDDMMDKINYSLPDLSPPPTMLISNDFPSVDRTSKAAAVQKYEERARSMHSILEKQEKLADNSLNLEKERIQAEQSWEKINLEKEVEQRDELRAQYKLREQEILSVLMQLENRQYDMEQENIALREKLEEYEQKEMEDVTKMADEKVRGRGGDKHVLEQAQHMLAAKHARIEEVRAQKDSLDQQRQALEHRRKRALLEARLKKKPELDKDEDGDTYMVSPGDSPGATGLNRSQSSPNIAKISSDEDEMPTPSFDRSTKPLNKVAPSSDMQRQRDFQPVWGDVGRGLTGLKNLGNTCYMNSIIQCLNNTEYLVTYFCNGQYLEHVNRSHVTRGAIAEELAAVIRALSSGQYKFIAIKDLRNEVGKHQRSFRGCEQQDSHEFLTILMDWLHDDLQVTIKPHPKDTLSAPDKAWQEYTKSRESVILKLFYGQIKSTVRCTVCDSQSVNYETFSNLSLELPPSANRCTLADCLKLYLNGETIRGWNCPKCKEKRDAVKKLDISRLPPVLVIHFKRFYVDPKEYCNVYRKKQTYIDFPLDNLDTRQFSLPGNSVYNLYAVSNHYGSMEGGHYTAYCKSSWYNKWYKYDDHVVSDMSPMEVNSSAAYILFYARTS